MSDGLASTIISHSRADSTSDCRSSAEKDALSLACAIRVGDEQRELFAHIIPDKGELLAVGRKADGVPAV